jgi:hypothetical protein
MIPASSTSARTMEAIDSAASDQPGPLLVFGSAAPFSPDPLPVPLPSSSRKGIEKTETTIRVIGGVFAMR